MSKDAYARTEPQVEMAGDTLQHRNEAKESVIMQVTGTTAQTLKKKYQYLLIWKQKLKPVKSVLETAGREYQRAKCVVRRSKLLALPWENA